VAWDQTFFDPIMLPNGKKLITLRDAAECVTELPKAEHDIPEWQAAMKALLLVVENSGPPIFARIGVMRALNRHVEPAFRVFELGFRTWVPAAWPKRYRGRNVRVRAVWTALKWNFIVHIVPNADSEPVVGKDSVIAAGWRWLKDFTKCRRNGARTNFESMAL
jgi:hypothetical protein